MTKYALVASLLVALLAPPPAAAASDGWATWYGPGFHGKVMANGQIYDQYDPTTTACNLYPFGTWLKVTNPANGATVYVQVRDRGAFGHALDLSYAAFRLLDDPARMWLQVRYEVVSGPPTAPAPAPTPSPTPTPTAAPERPQASARSGRADQPIPAGQYVVQPGETLWSIAQRAGLSVSALQQANGLGDSSVIRVGQVLVVGAGAEGAAPAAAAARQHLVAAGETLSEIAERYGVSVAALQQANGLGASDLIQIGQALAVPRGAGALAAAPREHVVLAGETLSEIAERYGVSVAALQQANGLGASDLIQIGQRLAIPGSGGGANAPAAASPRKYVVQPGDTLSGIADAAGTDSRHLAELNGIDDPDALQPGQTLLLP